MKKVLCFFNVILLLIFAETALCGQLNGVSYHMITKNSKDPIDLSLRHVEFIGTNTTVINNLNRAVKDIWADDEGCDLDNNSDQNDSPTPEGEYHRSLEVKKITSKAVMLQDTANYSCPGAAHPDSYSWSYIIAVPSGELIDLWERLTKDQRDNIRSFISTSALKTLQDSGCRVEYQLEALKQYSIKISVDADKVSLEPEFPHVIQACVDSFSMPLSEFEKYFEGDKEALAALRSLHHQPKVETNQASSG